MHLKVNQTEVSIALFDHQVQIPEQSTHLEVFGSVFSHEACEDLRTASDKELLVCYFSTRGK